MHKIDRSMEIDFLAKFRIVDGSISRDSCLIIGKISRFVEL